MSIILFCDESNNYVYTNANFIRKTNSVVGTIAMIGTATHEFPGISSSTDNGFQKPIKKMYSEHLERYCTSLSYESNKEIVAYDIVNEKVEYIKRKTLSYGKSARFGHVDTTGTSARDSLSCELISKALSELIEKNELFLFWFHGMGQPLECDSYVKKRMHEFGLEYTEYFIFYCSNISTWPTVILVLVDQSRIITTGISCNKKLNAAIDGAINEAKTLQVMNMLKFRVSLDLNKEEHIAAIERLRKIRSEPKNYILQQYIFYKEFDVGLAEWVRNLEISFIGNKRKAYKAVSISSDSLIKCVPVKKKLKNCLGCEIIMRNPIENIDNIVDCIII